MDDDNLRQFHTVSCRPSPVAGANCGPSATLPKAIEASRCPHVIPKSAGSVSDFASASASGCDAVGTYGQTSTATRDGSCPLLPFPPPHVYHTQPAHLCAPFLTSSYPSRTSSLSIASLSPSRETAISGASFKPGSRHLPRQCDALPHTFRAQTTPKHRQSLHHRS